jgi:hypothetical protein
LVTKNPPYGFFAPSPIWPNAILDKLFWP